MMDTPVGQAEKDDPADVAAAGFAAMMAGSSDITPGLKNKLMAAAANIAPNELLAKAHRGLAEPNSNG